MFVRLFILPHMCVGVILLLSVPAHLFVARFGTPVTAIVDRMENTPTRKGGVIYDIYYQYTLDRRRYDKRASVGKSTYNLTRVGDHRNGRASGLWGHALFVGPEEWEETGPLGMLGFALFWNGILSVFVYVLWVVPLRERWIARIGQPALAIVTGRRELSGRGGRIYRLSYAFTTPEGTEYTGKCDVTNWVYQIALEGTTLIVLYDPRRPRWNLAYEYCDFVVAL
ncbi:MAG: DUF3592 domain-containing protein [Tepidisphaeraceae bacterium]|jgi:uncharacterized protein DUF3592